MALEKIGELEKKEPNYPPFVSVRNQILFLISYLSGHEDGKKLAGINLGYIAMREIEPQDEDVANIIYSVSAEVEKMTAEYAKSKS